MTQEESELLQIAERFWLANKEIQLKLADAIVAKCGIPPILTSIPGTAAFFTMLQKQSFMAGVMSAFLALEKAEQRIVNEHQSEGAPLAGGKPQ